VKNRQTDRFDASHGQSREKATAFQENLPTTANSKEKIQEASKRRATFVGPSTAAIIVGLIALSGLRDLMPRQATLERHVSSRRQTVLLRKTSVSHLLCWASKLRLSPEQTKLLQVLSAKQQQTLAPVEADLNAATQNFEKLRARNSISLVEIQTAAEPLSALSTKKRMILQDFAQQGNSLLRKDQSEQAAQLLHSLSQGGYARSK
jgi:hypothetical protein